MTQTPLPPALGLPDRSSMLGLTLREDETEEEDDEDEDGDGDEQEDDDDEEEDGYSE